MTIHQECFGKIGTEGEKQLGSASLPTGWRHKTSAGDVGPRTVRILLGIKKDWQMRNIFCKCCCMVLWSINFNSNQFRTCHFISISMLFFYRLQASYLCLGASCVVKGCHEPACPYLLGPCVHPCFLNYVFTEIRNLSSCIILDFHISSFPLAIKGVKPNQGHFGMLCTNQILSYATCCYFTPISLANCYQMSRAIWHHLVWVWGWKIHFPCRCFDWCKRSIEFPSFKRTASPFNEFMAGCETSLTAKTLRGSNFSGK